ncbi:hypothetical protein EMCRGX_G022767 [Ephydatia muelleri]
MTLAGQNIITWNNMPVANNSLVTLSVVANRVSTLGLSAHQAPLVCQGIAGGQCYEPNGALYPLATPDPVLYSTGDYGQRNESAGVELYRGTPVVFPHRVQCCTNTTITFCVGLYTDLTLANSVDLSTAAYANYTLSVAATFNANGSSHACALMSMVTDKPTSTYNNTLIVTGRQHGMYTCSVTTTCSPVCGATGFTFNPRSTTSSLTVPAPPGPHTGVTAVQSGPTSVNASWTAPTSGGPVSRYDIYYVANGVPIRSTPSLMIAQVTSASLTVTWDHVVVVVVGVCLLAMPPSTELQEFSPYTLTITASNGGGSSPPARVLVNTSSAGELGGVPCLHQNSVIVGYRVLYGAVPSGVGGTVATSGRTLTVTRLSPYTNYSIEVSAVNSDGAMGPYSSPLLVATALRPVSGLQATNNTFTTITLTWQPPPVPNGVIIMYQVTYSYNGSVNTYNTTTPPVTITELVPMTTYTFSVVCYTISAPGTPQQVQTSTATIHGILTGYTVYYRSLPNTSKMQSGGYTSQTFPPTTTSGDITNLNPNDLYQFSVAAMVTIMGQLYTGGILPSGCSTISPGGSPSSTAGSGAAIGGAVGGAAFVIFVTMAILLLMRRNRGTIAMTGCAAYILKEDSKSCDVKMQKCEAYRELIVTVVNDGQGTYKVVGSSNQYLQFEISELVYYVTVCPSKSDVCDNGQSIFEGLITPEYEGPITPKYEGLITPEHEGLITPEYEGLMTPEYEGLITSDHEGLITPEHEGLIIPEHEGLITSEYEGLITPENEGLISEWTMSLEIYLLSLSRYEAM